jgi:hypothetical protein
VNAIPTCLRTFRRALLVREMQRCRLSCGQTARPVLATEDKIAAIAFESQHSYQAALRIMPGMGEAT